MDLTRGERITDLRKERGLTVDQLAEIVGVSKGTISNLENDKSSNVKVDFIVQLAKYFGVTTDYLLGISSHKSKEAADFGARTGLTDDSISALSKYIKSYPTETINMLNTIIQHRHFMSICMCVESYKSRVTTPNVVYEILSYYLKSDAFLPYDDKEQLKQYFELNEITLEDEQLDDISRFVRAYYALSNRCVATGYNIDIISLADQNREILEATKKLFNEMVDEIIGIKEGDT